MTLNPLNYERGKNTKLINSVMSEFAVALGKSRIIDSELFGMSKVMDSSTVDKSRIDYLGSVFGDAFVKNSYVGGSAVISGKGSLVNGAMFNASVITDKATVINSIVFDSAKIVDDSVVIHSHIGGNVTVAGTAFVKGLTLEDDQYLIEGDWTVPPTHIPFSVVKRFGLPLALTESVDDKWMIGCTGFTYDFWMRHPNSLKKAAGLEDWQIDLYKVLLTKFRVATLIYRGYEAKQKQDENK